MGEMTVRRRPLRARPWALAAIAAGLSMGAFTLGRSWASGVPASDALVYSGALEGPDGEAVSGEPIVIRFWSPGGNQPRCEADDPTRVRWTGGRFSVALPATCADAVHAEPNLEVEVLIGAERASLGRVPISAVPYALEAARASEATGTLASTLTDLQAGIAQLQQSGGGSGSVVPVVKSNKENLQRVAPGEPGAILTFDTPVLLELGQFDGRAFTAQQRGIYQFSCSAYYRAVEDVEGDGQGDWSGWLSVELRRDPAGAAVEEVIARDGFVSDGYKAYRRASTLVELLAGDRVSCAAVYEPEESETEEVAIGGAGNGITAFEGYLVTWTTPAAQ
jgi:hypothetical protein